MVSEAAVRLSTTEEAGTPLDNDTRISFFIEKTTVSVKWLCLYA